MRSNSLLSSYYDIEVSAEEGDPAAEAGSSAVGDAGRSLAAGATEEKVVVIVDEPPA